MIFLFAMRKEEVQQKRDLVGDFFEHLSARIFGGEVQQKGGSDSENGAPNIINWKENQAYEVKAITRGDWLKVQPNQVAHYGNFKQQVFPLDNPEVYYFFWSYERDRKSPLIINDLEATLVQSHKAVLILSLDVVEAGLKIWKKSGSNGWPEYAALSGPDRRSFFTEPKLTLRNLFLNPENYFIEEKKFGARKHLGKKMAGFRARAIYNKDLNGLSVFQGNVSSGN